MRLPYLVGNILCDFNLGLFIAMIFFLIQTQVFLVVKLPCHCFLVRP